MLQDNGVKFEDTNVIKVDFFHKRKAIVSYPLIINPDLPMAHGEDFVD